MGVSLLVLLGLWALRSPWVQNLLVPHVQAYLSRQLGAPVEVGEVYVDLPAKMVLRNVYLRDQQRQPMFSIRELRVSLLSLPLGEMLTQPKFPITMRLNTVEVVQPEGHLYRRRADSTWNYAFLIPKSDTTKPSKPLNLDFNFREVSLRGGIFSFVDSTKSDSVLAIRNRMNYSNMDMRAIQGDLSFHLMPGMYMEADLRRFSVIEANSLQMVRSLTGLLTYDQHGSQAERMHICLENGNLRAGRTQLSLDADFADERPDSVKEGMKPTFSALLRPSIFDFSTLNKFLPKPLPMQDPVSVNGYIWGDDQGIYSDSVDLALYQHTRLRTTVRLTDYTETDQFMFMFGIGNGRLSFEELKRFLKIPSMPLYGVIEVDGPVEGNLERLKATKMHVRYLDDTELFLNARLYDYTKGSNMAMDIQFKNSYLSFAELRRLLPSMQLPLWMNRFGRSSIDGRFVGGVSDFVVNADFNSAYGGLSSDLHLVLPPKEKEIHYSGGVVTRHLNFVGLEADLPVRSSDFNFAGQVDGYGSSWGQIVADVQGELTESDIQGYKLQKLVTKDLKVDHYKITGGVELDDPKGNASLTVYLDMPEGPDSIDIMGDVERLDLKHYDILPSDSVFLSSVMNIRIRGDSLENYRGRVRFMEVLLERQNTEDSLKLSDVVLGSRLVGENTRRVRLRSSLADMSLSGDFNYNTAIKLVQRLGTETKLYIQNNDSLTDAYYASKVVDTAVITIRDTLTTKYGLNDFFEFFKVPVYVDSGTTVITELSHGAQDVVTLQVLSDSFAVSGIGFERDSVHAILQKEATNNDLIGIGYVHFDKVRVSPTIEFSNVTFEPSAITNELNCFLRAYQPQQNNEIILSTTTNFLPSGEIRTQVKAGESRLGVRGRSWVFSPGNSVVRKFEHPPSLRGSYPDSIISRYHVSQLELVNDSQSISLSGVVSSDFTDVITATINDVRIKSITEIFTADTTVDGRIVDTEVTAWNLMTSQPSLYTRGEVKDFRFGEVDSLGIRFLAGWPFQKEANLAGLRVEFGHWGQDSLVLEGSYNMAADQLDFNADSSTVLLQWVEPLMKGILSDMEGRVAIDRLTVKGSLKKPLLDGEVRFSDTQFKVDFFNNVFRLSDNTLTFDNEKIQIPAMTLQDTLGGSAQLNGYVYYNDTNGVRLDLRVNRIRNLLLMDSRKQHNELFYGHLVLDGDSARITDYLVEPYIQAWVKTGDDSWLDIPLSSYTSASRLDYVEFIVGGKPIVGAVQKKKSAGFKLALRVAARPNTKVRLIFDEFAGDLIEARGEGNLFLNIDKYGDFTMFGTYTVLEGDYHFTYANVVNKEFKLKEGGQIVWSGSPFNADLDIQAVYEVNADASALLAGSSGTTRIPVEIVMKMKGDLENPEISLELEPSGKGGADMLGLDSYFKAIQYDQQELNKQVVSLLVFRRFAANTGYTSSGGASSVNVTSSISELVSNQVNHWISQAFDDPNFGVEVNTNEFQDVELALRASLFNDRVTIERNGTIVGNTNNNVTIGDLSMFIKLLPKADSLSMSNPNAGQVMLEIFNREDAGITSRNNVSQGAGVFFKKDFDQVSDLFKKRQKARKEEPVEIEEKKPKRP